MTQASHIMVQKHSGNPEIGKNRVKRVIYKRNHRFIRMAGAVAGVFVLGLLSVFICSQAAVSGYQIVQLKHDIAGLEKSNKRLELRIAQLSSLDRIEAVATTKLGMYKPHEAQMVAIEEAKPTPVVDTRTRRVQVAYQPQKPESRPLEKIYQVIMKLASRNRTIGMSE